MPPKYINSVSRVVASSVENTEWSFIQGSGTDVGDQVGATAEDV